MKIAKLIVGLVVIFGTYAHAGITNTYDHFSQEDEAILARIDAFLINRNIMSNDRSEQIVQEYVQHLITEDDNMSMRQMAIDTADLALRVSGHSGSTTQLSRISSSELKNIQRHQNDKCIAYYAALPNGDMLSCNFFIAGPCKGQIDCTRMVMTRNGQTVMLPVRDSLYFELERLYNQHNNQPKA